MKNGAVPFPAAHRRAQALAPASGVSWYRIQDATKSEAKVYIYDVIAWYGVTADQFVRDLDKITAQTIHLHINSPGGDVFDGYAIYNGLKNHSAKVIVHIDGVAASIASVIAMAGSEVRMGEGTWLMIHKPWSFTIGDDDDHREVADLLGKLGDSIASTYVKRTGLDRDEVIEMMAAETWMNADDAIAKGFADVSEEAEADEDEEIAARFDFAAFLNTPKELTEAQGERRSKQRAPTVRETEKALRDAGHSIEAAKAIIASGFKAASDARDEPDDSPQDNIVAELESAFAITRFDLSLRRASTN